jgi:hypothetical protein
MPTESKRVNTAPPQKLPHAVVAASEHVRVQQKNALLWRVIAFAVVLIGWIFISWANRYRFTAPVVMLQLGWLAVIFSIYFLTKVGASAAAEIDERDVWWKPVGAIEDLQQQKRSLLKAIKEVEFDQQMGKQSEADAREIISVYRAAAIDVIKAIEAEGAGSEGLSPREQIAREVRARVQVAGNSTRNANKQTKGNKRDGKDGKAKKSDVNVADAASEINHSEVGASADEKSQSGTTPSESTAND